MKKLIFVLLCLFPVSLAAQAYSPSQGWCEQGGVKVVTQGLNSTNTVQASYPGCTVTVYVTGGSTLATIYSNPTGTPLANPFTATANGMWTYYTSASTYVVLSGGTPAFPAPVTVIPSGITSSGITSVNSQTGPALTIAVGAGLAITSTGNVITISLGTTFAITSFTGGSTVELGYSVVNPSFAATYSVTPASANITNTESISSPTNLVTPFTSGTITGIFVHTSVETTTFTLSATQGTTQTATQTISWQPSIFGGAGTAGATSTVTASGTTAVLSNSNVLPRTQLGAETVGETFGPYSPSGQVIYLLLTGGSHTFTDAGTGFPMAFNAPLTVTFLNANGVTLTMYLYQSTNSLYGTYTPKVAS